MTAAAVAALGTLGLIPAEAATAPIGSYASYTQTAPGVFDASFGAASGLPAAHIVTDDLNASAASGRSAFLGQTTGFGQTFGSSRLQPYLTIAPISTTIPSTTTVTFAAPIAPGWGFAVGDIDADYVTITAANGATALTPAQFGAQNTTNVPYLNYCRNASPKPGSCTIVPTPPADYDVPAWCPTTGLGAPCTGLPAGTVAGRGTDTQGAYDWFMPTVALDTLTLSFHRVTGIPNFQLWLVGPEPAATVTGTITPADPAAPVPAGTGIALLDGAGVAVANVEGDPVIEPVAADGTYSFVTGFGNYQAQVVLPAGSTDVAPAPFAFAVAGDPVSLPTLAVSAAPAVVVPAADPGLAATGVDAALPLLVGGGILAAGVVLLVVARRRSRRI